MGRSRPAIRVRLIDKRDRVGEVSDVPIIDKARTSSLVLIGEFSVENAGKCGLNRLGGHSDGRRKKFTSHCASYSPRTVAGPAVCEAASGTPGMSIGE